MAAVQLLKKKSGFSPAYGVNAVRTALGQCGHLNYTGVLYEEYGVFVL
jgi:hypothetical protein